MVLLRLCKVESSGFLIRSFAKPRNVMRKQFRLRKNENNRKDFTDCNFRNNYILAFGSLLLFAKIIFKS